MWMATGKDASRVGAECRRREGIFLGLSGAGQSANDHAFGTPDVKGLPRDRKRHDPTVWVSVPRTPLPARVCFCQQSLQQEEMEARETSQPATGVTSEGTSTSRSMVKFRDVKIVLQLPRRMIDQSLTTANAQNEWKVPCVRTQLEAERLGESKRRQGVVAPGPDVVMGQSIGSSGAAAGSGEVHAPRGTRSTAEDAGFPSVQDLADSRPVQSAQGEMMRLAGADLCNVGGCATSCSLFDMLPEVVLDLRTGWSLNEPARAKCWATLE